MKTTKKMELNIGGTILTIYHKTLPDLPDLSDRYNYWEKSDEEASNGMDSLYIYNLADGLQLEVYTEQGHPTFASVVPRRPIWMALAECYYETDLTTWLAEWGIDPGLTPADPKSTYDNYRIWVTPNYYSGTCGAPISGWLLDDDGNPIDYPSYQAAQDAVDEYYNAPSCYDGIPACNVLSHGQAGSDDMMIVEYH